MIEFDVIGISHANAEQRTCVRRNRMIEGTK